LKEAESSSEKARNASITLCHFLFFERFFFVFEEPAGLGGKIPCRHERRAPEANQAGARRWASLLVLESIFRRAGPTLS
jgi:hypothetical protein